MEKIPLTAKGFAKLDSELRKLKSVERPAVIAAIAEAREHGDLSENAEYHAARERQSFIEGRIRELEAMIGRFEAAGTLRGLRERSVALEERILGDAMVRSIPDLHAIAAALVSQLRAAAPWGR